MASLRHALCLLAIAGLAACGLRSAPGTSARLEVVAAEDTWGSIAAQLGGARVHVTSLIVNPATDPHEYEPAAADARAVAVARYVVENGAGYDSWAAKLVAANPDPGRAVLDVARLLGKAPGDNPHFWYSPGYVLAVADRVTADLRTLDPAGATYYGERNADFKDVALAPYRAALAGIARRHAGARVAATETLFVYLAQAASLDIVTPAAYMRAVTDGSDPSAADVITVDAQVSAHGAGVLLFNAQNATPRVTALVARARAAGVPVVAMTETVSPAGATFQEWQTRQLAALLEALGG